MQSVITIQTDINNAQINQTGEVAWSGSGGEQAILTDIVTTIRERGIYYVTANSDGTPNTAILTSLNGSQSTLVYVQKSGLYYWDVVTSAYVLWDRAITSYIYPAGAGGTSWSIAHNKGNIFPTVKIFATTYGATGLPYYSVLSGYTVQITDSNNIVVTADSATTEDWLIIIE